MHHIDTTKTPGGEVRALGSKTKRLKKLRNLCKCPWTQSFTFEKIDTYTMEEFTREVKRAFCPDNENEYIQFAELLISYTKTFKGAVRLGKQQIPRVDDFLLNGWWG